MDSRPVEDQIVSGLWIAAKALLVMFTGGLLVGGVAMLRMPAPSDPGSVWAQHSIMPWACVIVATAILIPTIDRWVTILPGLFACGFFAGLTMIASGSWNNKPVPRGEALALTAYMVATSILTLSFCNRDLRLVDRIALMGFVFCFALTGTPDTLKMNLALSIGFTLLILAWGANRMRDQRYRKSSHQRVTNHIADGARR